MRKIKNENNKKQGKIQLSEITKDEHGSKE